MQWIARWILPTPFPANSKLNRLRLFSHSRIAALRKAACSGDGAAPQTNSESIATEGLRPANSFSGSHPRKHRPLRTAMNIFSRASTQRRRNSQLPALAREREAGRTELGWESDPEAIHVRSHSPSRPLAAALLGALLLASCSAPSLPRRNPVGEQFPAVQAEFLTGDPIELPSELAGQPAILLVGFEMETQFDLDRWILGLVQLKSEARIIEVPTIPGLVPGLISNTIDQGMRDGIPSEDWLAVATVYGEGAKRIAELTGNESALNGRILLLDSSGRIAWFHDRGYSAGKLMQLHQAWSELVPAAE